MLEMEKQRLVLEMQRAERRGAEIRARLIDMGKKALRLQRFVEKLDVEMEVRASPAAASPLQVHAPNDKLKRRRLSY
jgi:hypothetical protein